MVEGQKRITLDKTLKAYQMHLMSRYKSLMDLAGEQPYFSRQKYVNLYPLQRVNLD